MAECILVEGCDAMGKGTQIEKIKSFYEKKGFPVHIIHYSNVKGLSSSKEIKKYSEALYKDMFELCKETNGDRVLILDRAHLGEYVYSPMYRDYDGSYVFDLEKDLLGFEWAKVKLMLFTDDVKAVLKRDKDRNDGKSFTLDPEKKAEELEMFNKAFELSSLKKHKIELKGRTPDEIFEEDVKPFLLGTIRSDADTVVETPMPENEEKDEPEEKPKKTRTTKTQTTKKKMEAKK